MFMNIDKGREGKRNDDVGWDVSYHFTISSHQGNLRKSKKFSFPLYVYGVKKCVRRVFLFVRVVTGIFSFRRESFQASNSALSISIRLACVFYDFAAAEWYKFSYPCEAQMNE